VVLVALVLAVIPLVGYVHVKQIERLLRDGQEQALRATARAIAMALHDRPQLLGMRPGEPASDEMQLILKSLARAESRVWIVDQNQRLLALVGDLKSRPPEDERAAPLDFATRLVHPLTARLLDLPTEDFDDSLPESEIAGPAAVSALQGVPARRLRPSVDGRATIVSAAYPIWSGEQVIAAVVAEETTNTARSVYNRALEQVVAVTLIAFLAGALALLAFASRLSSRLGRLRDEAEAAIDSQGRVRKLIAGSAAGDEIGDLSRSFSTMLERLAEYNRYLENMAGRLSHELRTPIAVVRSSLENLRLHSLPPDAGIYLARANEGLQRLDKILTRMSEATRLESLVREHARERFDARAVLQGMITGYAAAYPGRKFELDAPDSPVWLRGAPDLYAQMLDKLVANAVDFATNDEPIRIRLDPRGGEAILTVSNRGPRLPEAMAGKLFESMVSVRAAASGSEPHLGLGLYIVRLVAEFHGGRAQALDREDGSGVVIKVTCPLD
jgi:two-component system, OmpR family, sensor histidine kinase ChvG